MHPISPIELETFLGLEGSIFTVMKTGPPGAVDLEFGPVELTLVKSTDRSSEYMTAFSVLFHGPKSQEFGQGNYKLFHTQLHDIDLFLVPVLDPGLDAELVCYEAVFSRLKE
ncbi:DUF6916 family protein [Candidatus Bipolaricaulota bacterium]